MLSIRLARSVIRSFVVFARSVIRSFVVLTTSVIRRPTSVIRSFVEQDVPTMATMTPPKPTTSVSISLNPMPRTPFAPAGRAPAASPDGPLPSPVMAPP